MKKILSIVLSIVMLASVVCINVDAAANTYNGYASIQIDKTNTFNPDNFEVILSIDSTDGCFCVMYSEVFTLWSIYST